MILRLFFSLFLLMVWHAPASFAQGLQDTPQAYLDEMDRFHAYCLRNETYNQNYECECLSVKFLDMRKTQGADVTTGEIVQNLRSECLKDPSNMPALPADATALGGITNEQYKEARDFLNTCKADQQLSMAYECECLAANYLDQRILRGPEPPTSAILMYIANTCPNTAGMAGMTYRNCINLGTLMPTNQPLEKFCTCLGNRFAKMYGELGMAYSSDLRVSLQSRAMDECSVAP